MNYPHLKNFAAKNNGLYYLKNGIVASVTYSKKKPFLVHIYTPGDFVGIDKFQEGIGVLDYFILTECDYEIVNDEELTDQKYKQSFLDFLKTFLHEITAYRSESYEKILQYNLEKISRFSNEIEGLPLAFVKEMGIKSDLDKLLENNKIMLEDEEYKIKK